MKGEFRKKQFLSIVVLWLKLSIQSWCIYKKNMINFFLCVSVVIFEARKQKGCIYLLLVLREIERKQFTFLLNIKHFSVHNLIWKQKGKACSYCSEKQRKSNPHFYIDHLSLHTLESREEICSEQYRKKKTTSLLYIIHLSAHHLIWKQKRKACSVTLITAQALATWPTQTKIHLL